MKLHLAVAAAFVAAAAFVGTPQSAEAGGLHHLCPTHWVKHMAHHHHHHAKKVVVKKKAYKAAAKPAKKVAVKKVVKKAPAKKPLK